MIEVKIPSEIREYKSKLILGLSTRQVVSIGGALILGVPTGVIGRHYIPEDILMWLIIIMVVPFIGFGFLSFEEMRFEDFAKAFLSFYLLPQKRVYEDTADNIFCSFSEEIMETDILQQRIENGEYDDFEFEEDRREKLD